MICSIIKINPHPWKQDEILEILRTAGCAARTKGGCLGSEVYLKKFEEEVILYLETWQSREDFERHVRSRNYDRILAAMDLARDPPEVRFFEMEALGGLDLIAAIRKGGRDARE